MSRVIGFRLDRDNPREAQALAVLEAWQEAGYSTRHILTEALLRLDEAEENSLQEFPVGDIVAVLEQVSDQLAQLQREGLRPREAEASETSLEEAFLLSVKRAAKPPAWAWMADTKYTGRGITHDYDREGAASD